MPQQPRCGNKPAKPLFQPALSAQHRMVRRGEGRDLDAPLGQRCCPIPRVECRLDAGFRRRRRPAEPARHGDRGRRHALAPAASQPMPAAGEHRQPRLDPLRPVRRFGLGQPAAAPPFELAYRGTAPDLDFALPCLVEQRCSEGCPVDDEARSRRGVKLSHLAGPADACADRTRVSCAGDAIADSQPLDNGKGARGNRLHGALRARLILMQQADVETKLRQPARGDRTANAAPENDAVEVPLPGHRRRDLSWSGCDDTEKLRPPRAEPDIGRQAVGQPAADEIAGRAAAMDHLVMAAAAAQIACATIGARLLAMNVAIGQPGAPAHLVRAVGDRAHRAGFVVDEAVAGEIGTFGRDAEISAPSHSWL